MPDARRGVLQDVHWSVGLFGYFPTYTLGNIYAAELHAALRRDIGAVDALLAAGELAPILDWLGARTIHRRGRLLAPRALVAAACGREPDAATLLGELEAKYGALYGLTPILRGEPGDLRPLEGRSGHQSLLPEGEADDGILDRGRGRIDSHALVDHRHVGVAPTSKPLLWSR